MPPFHGPERTGSVELSGGDDTSDTAATGEGNPTPAMTSLFSSWIRGTAAAKEAEHVRASSDRDQLGRSHAAAGGPASSPGDRVVRRVPGGGRQWQPQPGARGSRIARRMVRGRPQAGGPSARRRAAGRSADGGSRTNQTRRRPAAGSRRQRVVIGRASYAFREAFAGRRGRLPPAALGPVCLTPREP